MATRDDIIPFTGSSEMTFYCRVCKTQFASIPMKEVFQRQANATLKEETDRLVDLHLKNCK
jgi:hypothetical protein